MAAMLFLLSPAKSLDYETPLGEVPHTLPLFVKQSTQLIKLLRQQSVQDISELMDLSEALSTLNVKRYKAWRPKFTADNAKQAVLAFDGDVYGGLDAKTLKTRDLAWAQDHVRILSGLYGVLRPLDWMQPYRLEMGTRLANPGGSNLYRFWGSQISEFLNQELAADKTHKTHKTPVVVNLASQEYFKAVDLKVLKARVVECVFEEYKNGQYKVISFMAKRARGLMARYAVTHHITTVEKLRAFDLEGYAFAPVVSHADRLVFRRK
ncbi:MAG: hypothetical protein RL211_408 [Pseudomonadota bacterium]|jgi:cytoplasmic iron level regulating protein YaaA (DUF328/UPF0246 family)